jgi:F0F1-type ATP synthase membrane subunit c/vacuolar-type H+-ATPase subunit K
MSQLAVGCLALAAVAALPLWPVPSVVRRRWAADGDGGWVLWVYAVPVVLLLAAAALAVASPGASSTLAYPVAAVAALAAGGPVTTAVLELADRSGDADHVGEPPVLRGGAWIGVLERLAVVATLLAGWPEGLAVVLGIKGLARYPELREPTAAERFIIGTFTSVLWAAACAGVAALTQR